MIDDSKPVEPPEGTRGTSWLQALLQPILIAAVVTAWAMGPVVVLRLLVPSEAWEPMGPVIFIIALEAILTSAWLAASNRRMNTLAYRVAEFTVIVLALRLLTWFLAGGLPDSSAIRNYVLNPLAICDLGFVAYTFVALIAWSRSATFGAIFAGLKPDPVEVAYYSTPPSERGKFGIEAINLTDRTQLARNFLREWIFGAFFLILFAVLATFELSRLEEAVSGSVNLRNIGRLGLPPEMLTALLVYFMGGLWLATQARIAVMQARWMAEGVTVDTIIVKRWYRGSLLLLLAVGVIAAFLPIGSTLAISRILQIVAGVALAVLGLIVTLPLAIYHFLLTKILGQPPPPTPPEPIDLSQLLPNNDPSTLEPPSELTRLIVGSAFWIVAAIAIVAATAYFVRGRGVTLRPYSLVTYWNRLVDWFLGQWGLFTHGVVSVGSRLRAALPRGSRGEKSRPAWRFFRPGSLSPEEQIRFYYLSAARRASERGVERAPGETPFEYENDLRKKWPEAEEDVDLLTRAFVAARYGRRNLAREDVNPVKRSWRRLRAILRRRLD
jgi:hypothetical protein